MTVTRQEDGLELIGKHDISRQRASFYALLLGVLMGVVHLFLDVDLTLRWALLGWVAAALFTVVVLHEGVHGLVARWLGTRPTFGLKPPLVYVTFRDKVRRGHFILIALAPLVALDVLFGALYALGWLRLFWDLCFAVNTIGAIGDIWIVAKLLRYERGTWVQDTMTGIEVWRQREAVVTP